MVNKIKTMTVDKAAKKLRAMEIYRFTSSVGNLPVFLNRAFCNRYIDFPTIPIDAATGTYEYFHNGDRMVVNLETRELIWDQLIAGSRSSSALAPKVLIWIGKGLIEYAGECSGALDVEEKPKKAKSKKKSKKRKGNCI